MFGRNKRRLGCTLHMRVMVAVLTISQAARIDSWHHLFRSSEEVRSIGNSNGCSRDRLGKSVEERRNVVDNTIDLRVLDNDTLAVTPNIFRRMMKHTRIASV
jgi:hypothetical protein